MSGRIGLFFGIIALLVFAFALDCTWPQAVIRVSQGLFYWYGATNVILIGLSIFYFAIAALGAAATRQGGRLAGLAVASPIAFFFLALKAALLIGGAYLMWISGRPDMASLMDFNMFALVGGLAMIVISTIFLHDSD